jgi:uncharacterized membrane protein
MDFQRFEELAGSLETYEVRFRRERFGLWLLTLIGPFAATGAYLMVYWIVRPEKTWALMIAAALAFGAAGRFIIPLQQTIPNLGEWSRLLTPEEMFWWVSFQDVMVALFLSVHVGFMFRIPVIGHKIAELTVDSELILSKQPWMRRFTFLGLLAFIAFPLAATGSAGGAIFGRLLGLSRTAIFWGSALGGILGNAAMYFLAKKANDYLPQNNWLGIVIVIAIIVFLERRYASMKKEFLKQRTVAPPAAAEPQVAIADPRTPQKPHTN